MIWKFDGIPVEGHPGPEEVGTYGESYTFTARSHDVEVYEDLRRYQLHAGQYSLHNLASGRVAYTELHTGRGLLVELQPPSEEEYSFGGYYLVDSVTDNTTLPEELVVLEFELTFVAPLIDYPDKKTAEENTRTQI